MCHGPFSEFANLSVLFLSAKDEPYSVATKCRCKHTQAAQ